MIPITFKGIDYQEGGLYVMDKKNNWIDIDNIAKIGTVIFFDGKQKHKVEKIKSQNPKKQIGRIAVFAITTYFIKDTRLGYISRSVKIYIKEFFKISFRNIKIVYIKKLNKK